MSGNGYRIFWGGGISPHVVILSIPALPTKKHRRIKNNFFPHRIIFRVLTWSWTLFLYTQKNQCDFL
jgi:hypothetical protein